MLISSVMRLFGLTLFICSGLYTLAVLAVAQLANPAGADGQLLRGAGGQVVGSRQIAQAFTSPAYLWPRPSAAAYNGAAAAGSNLAVSNPKLRERAEADVMRYGATADRPLPQELATASGGGLDPHVTLEAALWQVPRIAEARGAPEAAVRAVIERQVEAPGGPLLAVRLINVLATNMALDTAFPLKSTSG
ncbi:potassium-transporting ATPase subunit C [Polymorphobacter sp.]|uniref:potassium-transporting ATPase subunit C n=1 Tax=Polymorphobacter sp. TaxID=1909290 RepID=UPI003F72090F